MKKKNLSTLLLQLLSVTSITLGSNIASADQGCSDDLSKTCALVYDSPYLSLGGKHVVTRIRFAGDNLWYNVTGNDPSYTYSFAVVNDKTGEVTLKSKTTNEVISLGTIVPEGVGAYHELKLKSDLHLEHDVQPGQDGWSNCMSTALGVGRKIYTKSEQHFVYTTSMSVQTPAMFYVEKVLSQKTSMCLF